MSIISIGINLAKNVFAVHGVKEAGKASIGIGRDLHSGCQVAAWIGLTPGQYNSGGKARLGRITKAGDRYLRSWLERCG